MEREQWITSTKKLAESIQLIREYKDLGKKDDDDRIISPKVAKSNTNKKMAEFKKNLSEGITRHKIRNNIITDDMSDRYVDLADKYEEGIEKRLKNLQAQIVEEQQYMMQYCPTLPSQLMVRECQQQSFGNHTKLSKTGQGGS
jgi:proline dehydrogenase